MIFTDICFHVSSVGLVQVSVGLCLGCISVKFEREDRDFMVRLGEELVRIMVSVRVRIRIMVSIRVRIAVNVRVT